jgi:hypothetical protein
MDGFGQMLCFNIFTRFKIGNCSGSEKKATRHIAWPPQSTCVFMTLSGARGFIPLEYIFYGLGV